MSHHEHEQGGEGSRDENPRTADEQEAPEPERPRTIQEIEGQSAGQQADPPKAEGDRDEAGSESRRD